MSGNNQDHKKRAAQRRIKDARFSLIKTPGTFDFKAQPSINQSLVRELMTGQYVDRHENVILVGNSATAKRTSPASWPSAPA